MSTIIAPGMWIAPIPPLQKLAETINVYVVDKPHYCTELDLIVNIRPRMRAVCAVCGNEELYLRVREHSDYCFCPTHWRPVLLPKAELLRTLLAPIPSLENADANAS